MKRVVIIGGGYGGTKALSVLASSGACEVVLIDRNRFHYRQAELHEFIASVVPLERVMIDLAAFSRKLGPRADFIHASVEAIEPQAQRVVLQEGRTLCYDALVVATGASTHFPKQIGGIDAFARDIKEFAGAFYNRQRFEELLFLRRKSSRVAIGGAGLSGVEIAAEMAHRARRLGLGPEELTVTLIEPMATVLPGMDPFLIEATQRALDALGVEQIHGRFITQVEADRVVLTGEKALACDLFIFTGGVVPRQSHQAGVLPRGERGEVLIEPTLQVQGFERIFAVGDVTQLCDSSGHPQPPTSQTAKQSGKCAAQNVLALFRGEALKPCHVAIRGVMVALGGHNAAGILWDRIRLKGVLAGSLKRLIFWLHARSFR